MDADLSLLIILIIIILVTLINFSVLVGIVLLIEPVWEIKFRNQ